MKDNPNPSSAINAVIGKEYSFRGQPLKFSMACFFALEKAGIPITEIESKPIETAAVVLFVTAKPKELVWSVLQRGLISRAAADFADSLTPEEFLAGKKVADEMICDYLASIATYSSGDAEKNQQAVAVVS